MSPSLFIEKITIAPESEDLKSLIAKVENAIGKNTLAHMAAYGRVGELEGSLFLVGMWDNLSRFVEQMTPARLVEIAQFGRVSGEKVEPPEGKVPPAFIYVSGFDDLLPKRQDDHAWGAMPFEGIRGSLAKFNPLTALRIYALLTLACVARDVIRQRILRDLWVERAELE